MGRFCCGPAYPRRQRYAWLTGCVGRIVGGLLGLIAVVGGVLSLWWFGYAALYYFGDCESGRHWDAGTLSMTCFYPTRDIGPGWRSIISLLICLAAAAGLLIYRRRALPLASSGDGASVLGRRRRSPYRQTVAESGTA